MSSPAYDRKAVFTLMLINFVDLLGFGLVVLLLAFDAKDFGASDLQVGLIGSVYALCQFIGAPLLGVWSDRIGRRPVLMVSQWGSVVGYLVLAYAMTIDSSQSTLALTLIFVSRVISGLTAGNITVTNAYVSDVVPAAHRAGVMGLLGAAFGLGFTFGPPLGGLLGWLHPALPGLASALMSALASLMVWKFLPESHVDRSRTASTGWAFSARSLASITRQPMALALTAIWFIVMLGYVMIEQVVPLMLESKETFGYDKLHAGLFMGAVGLVIVFVQGGLVRRVKDRIGEWNMAMLGTVVATIGLLVYAQATVTPLLWILAIGGLLNAFGRSLQTPTLTALLAMNSDPKAQGAAYGVFQGMGSLARVFGPMLGTAIYSAHAAAVFVVAAGLIAVSGVILVAIRKTLKSSHRSPAPSEQSVARARSTSKADDSDAQQLCSDVPVCGRAVTLSPYVRLRRQLRQ
jgi:MFS transporter, DHA1 family, tetracycline resistance protein